ncbi:replication factor C subunit, putative [Candida dubliniensis CD36]|uniref:Replication factor C subunit 2 n=1 Tax=Candida dubliniensis (strain CD36 / ATCC MYA-646 / CBS 7987 / NCPF 3949 / NRRL Y-17841) TaxID=573826 RepID=B9WJI6_CANDC|nr:replication factor C subunit, putative [Candida dubliniensis CD36]CAX40630.1 replication factor C subunit, putative [Candida dubliniensis CD36]
MDSITTSSIRKQKNQAYEEEKLHHTPWVEKYRPKSLSDVSSQEHTIKVLTQTIKSGNLPHMLFYGPPGTGKTSTILALAKELYGPNLYKSRVLELNASDERGISIVREKIKNFARLTISNPTKEDLANYPCPPYKIIILDEADSMTYDAQSALRRTMENYAGITRFVLICNYITRIIDPITSRCSKFRFKLLNNENAQLRLKYIGQQENLRFDKGQEDQVIQELLKISGGDLRKAITYLQSAAKLSETFDINDHQSLITIQSIRETAGILPDDILLELIQLMKQKSIQQTKLIKYIDQSIILSGWSAQILLDQLHDKLILDESINSLSKNKISQIFFQSDRKLNNGTDEHIQLLNVLLQISQVL